MSTRRGAGPRLYALLLHAYPRQHRDAYGEDMAEVFDDLLDEALPLTSAWSRLRFWIASFADLLHSIPVAWAAAAAALVGVSGGFEPPEPHRRLRARTTLLGLARDLVQDARVGIRAFVRRPAISGSAVAALALGIGGVTAIFSVVEGILLRPLPYADSERLVRVRHNDQDPESGKANAAFRVTPAVYLAWRAESRALDDLVAFTWDGGSLGKEGDFPLPGVYGSVSWNFFSFLGVEAELGRTFTVGDDPSSPRAEVALLSHSFWQQSYGADPAVIGREVVITGNRYQIVGVLPPTFRWYEAAEEPLAWIPRYLNPAENGLSTGYAVGRLRPGVTVDGLRAELGAIRQRVDEERGTPAPFVSDDPADWVTAEMYHEVLFGDARPGLLLLSAASGFLLLLACINVGNLLLASTAGRRRELAVRSSIGASRARIVRQLLTEALVLSGAGYLLGLAIAWGGVEALKLLAPADVPRMDELQLNGTVLGVSALLSIASGLLFGVVPALRASGSRRTTMDEGAWSSPSGLRRDPLMAGLVVGQVAVSLVILSGAGLMVHSLANLIGEDVGFEERGLWAAGLRMPPRTPYREDLGIPWEGTTRTWVLRTGWKTLPERLVERLTADARIAEATAAIGLPLSGLAVSWEDAFEANVNYVEPGFFEVLRIPVKAGRSFNTGDSRAGAPLVAMVNDVLAERYWPGESVVGKRFPRVREDLSAPGGYAPRDVEIVGIFGRIQEFALGEPPTPSVFLPRSQLPDTVGAFSWWPGLTLFVRPAPGAESSVGDAIADAVKALAPDVILNSVQPMSALTDGWLRTPRFYAFLLASFATVGLLLTAIGIGGVVSHTVGTGRREISIRMALGGRSSMIVRALVGKVMALTALGIAVGLLASFSLSRLLTTQLHNVEPTDPLALAGAAALVLAIASTSAWLPTRHISRTDPLLGLRAQ